MKRIAIYVLIILLVSMICFCGYNREYIRDKVPHTVIKPKIFTYLEKDYTGSDRISLPYNSSYRGIAPFYKYCVTLMEKYSVIVITPENLSEYLTASELPFVNRPDSQLSFKNRSDLIGSALLYKYGGMFLERGTVMMKDPSPLLEKLKEYNLVTFGLSRNPPGPSCCSVENMPNNQILISRANNPMLKLYSQYLFEYCKGGNISGGNFDSPGTNALSKSLIQIKSDTSLSFQHLNYGATYDGTRDEQNNFVDFDQLLGSVSIKFKNPEKLYFISTPTYSLYNNKYSWFLKLSDTQFSQVESYIVRVLLLKLKSI